MKIDRKIKASVPGVSVKSSRPNQADTMVTRLSAPLARRQRRPELMDQPDLDPAEHIHALWGLARINRFSRSDAILWPAIARLARAGGGLPIRVLDLASGGGDVPIALAKRASRAGLPLEIAGCDVSPEAVRFARKQAEGMGASVRFFPLDVMREAIPAGYDVVTCSLFLHHLAEADACVFLRKAADAAGRLVLINDLVRDPLAYALAWSACRILTRSPVVRYDGPASVAGAFTLAEARRLAENAGLGGVTLARHWPRRFLLSWSR
jgi:2-polyprenyl-3-methyl-5-hydroxy-6-metoxy-1,4-benzoquinol methylase